MALAPMVLVLKKSFISWCSVKEAVFDYDYLNNLIIDSVFPYRNPLIFNLLNKKKIWLSLQLKWLHATFLHTYIDTMSEEQASKQGAHSKQRKNPPSDSSCGGKARVCGEFKKCIVNFALFDASAFLSHCEASLSLSCVTLSVWNVSRISTVWRPTERGRHVWGTDI